ncbi:MAG: T9SS type A sorting domain-containing protein [Crocinitomicaceae bacterium]|nr:T9SS type A sorting domain-containing protein [Flavobacteriales bacterium]NQZ35996.1 T9SS type A sorting domain-containing protein [Crocinitomicaceae bacterium]
MNCFITLLFLTVFGTFYGFSQASDTGINQGDLNGRTAPIIQYSKAHNKMFMLSQSFHSPGTYFLDTLNYSTNTWGLMDSSIVAEDFVTEDNGNITFVQTIGTNIELFSININGQILWSSTSSGVPSNLGGLRIKKGKNNDYWIYNGSTTIYNYQNGVWSDITGFPFIDFEINSLNEPIILSGYAQVKRYSGGNWIADLDSNIVYILGMQSQICIDKEDSIHHILLKPHDQFLNPMPTSINISKLDNNLLTPINSFITLAEEVTKVDIIADSNDVLHWFHSTMSLGPWTDITHGTFGAVMRFEDYPNHGGRFQRPIVDEYNCVHLPYSYSTDVFSLPDTTNSRVRKFCDCNYIGNQNTLIVQDQELISTINLPVNYQWIECDPFVTIAGANDSTYMASSNGDYAVIIETNGCADTSSCQTISTISIDQSMEIISDALIHPNPVREYLSVSIHSTQSIINGTITNTNGKIIQTIPLTIGSNTLDVSKLVSGVYLLHLIGEKEMKVVKFVKQ